MTNKISFCVYAHDVDDDEKKKCANYSTRNVLTDGCYEKYIFESSSPILSHSLFYATACKIDNDSFFSAALVVV